MYVDLERLRSISRGTRNTEHGREATTEHKVNECDHGVL